MAGVMMQKKSKIQKVNSALLHRSEAIKWVDSVIEENKSLVQVEQELARLRSKMGYVLVHTLVSRLSDDDAKVRNVSSWCLGLLESSSSKTFVKTDSEHSDKGSCKGCCSSRTSRIGRGVRHYCDIAALY